MINENGNTISIIQRIRSEGFEEGAEYRKGYISSLTQLERDDLIEQGKREAYRDIPSRLKWFIIGFLCCAVLVVIDSIMFWYN